MCDSQNAMMHQFSADNYYTFATENSQFGPDRGFRKIRPIIAGNAARERSRVKTLRSAFLDLQRTLPAVPPDTKLSKLDVLVLATTYIAHLMRTLNEGVDDNQLFAANGIMHPVKVWELSSHFSEDSAHIRFVWPNSNEKAYCFRVKKINIYCVYYLNLIVWLYHYISKLQITIESE